MRTFSLLRFGQGGESTRFGTAESEIQQPIPVALAEIAKTPESRIGWRAGLRHFTVRRLQYIYKQRAHVRKLSRHRICPHNNELTTAERGAIRRRQEMSKPKSKNHSFETMTTPFHKLGPKVLSIITSHLDYASASSFLHTSKVLSIYTRDHCKKGQKPFDHGPSMHDLLQIERWDCYDPIRPLTSASAMIRKRSTPRSQNRVFRLSILPPNPSVKVLPERNDVRLLLQTSRPEREEPSTTTFLHPLRRVTRNLPSRKHTALWRTWSTGPSGRRSWSGLRTLQAVQEREVAETKHRSHGIDHVTDALRGMSSGRRLQSRVRGGCVSSRRWLEEWYL